MKGVVKDLRPLIDIALTNPADGATWTGVAWVDSGFTGELLLPAKTIAALKLPVREDNTAYVGLGDGSVKKLAAFECIIDWFDEKRTVETLQGLGQLPLWAHC